MSEDVRVASDRAGGPADLSRDASQPVGAHPSRDVDYCEFEQGERTALLQVRSFIIKHGVKEVDAFCAQRLHDIEMDARR